MNVRVLKSVALVITVASLLFILGCEDPDGRASTSALKKKIKKLESDIVSMRQEMDGRNGELEEFRLSQKSQIKTRMDVIQNDTAKLKIEISTEINERTKEMSQNHLEDLQRLREDFDKSLKTVLSVDVAEETRVLRSEIEKVRIELIGFMDNQLKELYPYAYQPRRMDPKQPPEAPQQ